LKYSDEQRIEKILNYAMKLQNYISENNITKKRLITDESLQWLVTTPLYNIGEHSYNLSKEFKDSHTDVEWDNISALRHRLVHDYEGINWKIISDVIFKDLPVLSKQLQELMQNKQNGILDRFGSDKVEVQSVQEDAEKQKECDARFEAIQNVDLNAKPKTNAEKLQQYCKKSLQTHGEGYKDYVTDGVKLFLLTTPNVKLEQMTKLIDAVAPQSAYNSAEQKFSDCVKSEIEQDTKFQTKLVERDKTSKVTSR